MSPWQKAGAEAGITLWQDPTNAAWMVAGIRPGGMFLSRDGGKNWVHSSPEIKTTKNAGSNAQSLVGDPSNPKNLFSGIEQLGCWASKDGGESWKPCNEGIAKGRGLNGVSMAVHPRDSKIVFYGSDGGLYKSTDGGMHWRRITEGLPKGVTKSDPQDISCTVSKIVIDPKNPSNIYIALYAVGETEEAGCYVSRDTGETWQAKNKGITTGWKQMKDADFPYRGDWSFDLAIVPGDTSKLYIGTLGGLYVSQNEGESWQLSGYTQPVKALAIHPEDPRKIVVGTGARIFASEDGGATWTDVTGNLPTEMLPGRPDYSVDFVMPNGVVKKVGGTESSFVPIVKKLCFDRADPSKVWMVNHVGIFRATLFKDIKE